MGTLTNIAGTRNDHFVFTHIQKRNTKRPWKLGVNVHTQKVQTNNLSLC